MLLAARGRSNARIAAEVGVQVDAVRTWRGRFAGGGLQALTDRGRSGARPASPPCRSPRPRPWPATPGPRPGCRWRAGRARNWSPN
ncbi:helix-turn-helix domain-containing protein [Streptomyces virginiae]|uniref:helix-turn-helix domain-containing protein n=1 Tax=Streptomyces virginiae TaxID=1961 RepID=UPI0033B82FC0